MHKNWAMQQYIAHNLNSLRWRKVTKDHFLWWFPVIIEHCFPISWNASRNGLQINKKDQPVHFQLQEKNLTQRKWKLPGNQQVLKHSSASAGCPRSGATQTNQQKRADTCWKIKWHLKKPEILHRCWVANTFCPPCHASLQLCEMSSTRKQCSYNYKWENHIHQW